MFGFSLSFASIMHPLTNWHWGLFFLFMVVADRLTLAENSYLTPPAATFTTTKQVSATTSGGQPPPSASSLFYKFDCSADTFEISLTSFASIWAIINVVVVFIASIIFIMYACFTKFVQDVSQP